MDRVAELYLIRFDNGKGYVGVTVDTLKVRLEEHLSDAFVSGCKYIVHAAMRKYGRNSFKMEKITETEDIDFAYNVLESKYIDEYGTFMPDGYNMTRGGDSTVGYKHTEETKRKISESNKTNGIRGEDHHCFGLKHSDATKELIRIGNLGNTNSLGSVRSEETRRLMSDSAGSAKIWMVTLPDGSKIKCFNRKRFCLEKGLNYNSVTYFTLKDKPYKGYYFEEYRG